MTDTPRPRRDPARKSSKFSLGIAAILIVGGMLALWSLEPQAHSRLFGGPNPEWIWDSEWPRQPLGAHAFTVEREFEAPVIPDTTRLLILADQEYHLEVNGVWVGSGSYRGGNEWDAYQVADQLHVGTNLLRVGLRSSRGVGGLLVCLQARSGDRCWVASDDRWQVAPLDGSVARGVEVWGRAPIANWPLPARLRPRHRAEQCFLRPKPVKARRSVRLEEDRRLHGVEGEDVYLPVHSVRWGPRDLGLVEIDVDPSQRQLGVLAYGRKWGQPAPREALETVVTEPGQAIYRSTSAREMRFVEVDGLDEVPGGRYHPLDPRCTDWVFEAAPASEGLLGLDVPPSRSPVEDELRGRL